MAFRVPQSINIAHLLRSAVLAGLVLLSILVVPTNAVRAAVVQPLFVAVSRAGHIATSGSDFNLTESQVPGQWNGVVYGNQKWVAVGNAGQIATSPDGLQWQSTTLAGDWYSVAYGNGKYVAIGTKVAVSSDGISWSTPQSLASDLVKVRFINGVFFVTSWSSGLYQSVDGVNWTHLVTASYLEDIALGRGTYVLVKWDGQIGITTDLSSFQYSVVGGGLSCGHWLRVAYANQAFLATSEWGCVATSTDGTSWSYTKLKQIVIAASAKSSSTITALSWEGVQYLSTDRGQTWTSKNLQVDQWQEIATSVTESLAVGNSPRMMAFDQAKRLLFVANYSSNSVSVIDTSNNQVIKTITVESGPHGIAVDPTNNLVFVVNNLSNSVSAIDEKTLSVIDRTSIPDTVWGVSIDSSRGLAYVTTAGGQLYILNETNRSVVKTVAIGAAPNFVAVDSSTHRYYTSNYYSNSVSVLSASAGDTVIGTISVKAPQGVDVNSDTGKIYVASGDGNVYVFSATSNSQLAKIQIGSSAFGISVDVARNQIFVLDDSSNALVIIDGASNQVTASIQTDASPHTVSFDSSSSVAYVGYMGGGVISRIDLSALSFGSPLTGSTPGYSQVSVTDNYGCALRTDGSVLCTDASGNAAAPLASLTSGSIALSGVSAVKVVVRTSQVGCALLTDRTVKCWNQTPSPPSYSDFIDIQAGMCGLRQSGQIACWAPGANAPTNYSSSFTYTLLSSSWNTDRCALTNTNSLKCLGYSDHSYGSVPTFSAPVVQISAGRSSECAIDTNGLMKCWAGSLFGAVSGVKQVSIGESIGCYVSTANQVACQYVYGGSVSWMTPSSSLKNISSISVGSGEACAITLQNQMSCWGPYAPKFPTVKVAPSAPTVNAPTSPGPGQLTWTWSANSDGGSPITTYTWSGACSGSGNVNTVTCSGLTGGTNYTLTVTATNSIGTSDSGSSSLAMPVAPSAPSLESPTSSGTGQLTWTWSSNGDGGSPITSYSWSGACSGSGNRNSVTCSGLATGTNYTLTVTAINNIGLSDPVTSSFDTSVSSLASRQTTSSTVLTWSSAPYSWLLVTVQTSHDGQTWKTLGTSSTQSYTLTQSALSLFVRVVSSTGNTSDIISVTTPGLAPQKVIFLTSDGKPIFGGSVAWALVSGQARSSQAYGLLSDGSYSFPFAPGGLVNVTLQGAQLPDGALVSGSFRGILSSDAATTFLLPAEPSLAQHVVKVVTPGGVPVWGASVSISNLAAEQVVSGVTFKIPASYDPCSASTYYNQKYGCSVSGLTTDINGTVSYWGFYGRYSDNWNDEPSLVTVSYDDGYVTQTPDPVSPTDPTIVTLNYEPTVLDVTTSVVAPAPGVATPITITLNAGLAPHAMGIVSHAAGLLSGRRVTALTPSGYKACVGQSLTGVTNVKGQVTFKVCSTASGQVRFKTPGVIIPGAVSLYINKSVSLPVRTLVAKSHARGSLTATWVAPVFTGGASVTSYQITLSAPGKKSVVLSTTKTQVTATGLSNATSYTIAVVPITKLGIGAANRVVVPVA